MTEGCFAECLLSTTYFGPVQWYQKLYRYRTVWMERHDSFVKQTYRNRCCIATTHGVQSLTIPVEHGANSLLTRDTRISDHGNWRHLHWNAIRSAYGESPFFEFYADDLAPFFERRWTFLTDFNNEICALMCQLLDITPHLQPTTCFLTAEECANRHIHDFRDAIRPKHPLPDPSFQPQRYYQVFEGENGFLPNLSILDLLMNCGNESIFFL
ncbi:MAG: WbqC family protein [Prevotella sp.]|nr:WbqC family protein [Prevotella sp.]